MRNARGFTLSEVMMTVVIIGILAAIAIPSYHKTIERGYWRTAQDLLMAIYNGERAYYYTHDNTYSASIGETADMDVWRTIYVDNPNLESIPVAFSVSHERGPGEAFTATARRKSSRETLKIDQDRTWCGQTTCCAGCTWNP